MKLVCVVGPTGCGKTWLGVELAKMLGGEVVSCDSMQIYRGMVIGTAAPTEEEMQGVPHHMVGVADPNENYSVARYVEDASECVDDILARGGQPVIVGGTGLYMDALIECSTFSGDETDLSVRKKYEIMAREQGNEAVHACLAGVDPESAERLHPNNLKRVIRALEVYEQTGMTIGEMNRLHKRPEPKYQAIKLGLCPKDRQTLYHRIDSRVDDMIRDGLIDETRYLWENGLLAGTAAQAIGYKELLGYLEGSETLESCIELLKRRSRNYAKRQLTWLKRDDSIHWIYYNKSEEFADVLQHSTEYLQKHGVQ